MNGPVNTWYGLSLSYDIIKAHGGEIKVETKDGEGCKFIIYLPVWLLTIQKIDDRTVLVAQNNKESPVIIIEDDIDDQLFLQEVFKELTYPNEIIFFTDGLFHSCCIFYSFF